MRHLLITFIFIGTTYTAPAKSDTVGARKEYRNTITFSGAYIEYPRTEKLFAFTYAFGGGHIADQFGVFYYRGLSQNLRLMFGYSAWNTIPMLTKIVYGGKGPVISGAPQNYQKGALLSYTRYRMTDFALLYRYNGFDRHKLDVGIGPSYAWGVNSYLDSIVKGAVWEAFIYAHFAKADYFDAFAMLNYDYLLFRKRMAAGAGLKWRKYSGFYSPQIDYEVHVSVNF